MSNRNLRRAACFAALALALPAAAGAQTVWTGATGSWFDAGNWSAGVPDASADARVDNTGTCEIASTGATAHSVLLGFAATDAGTLHVDSNATLDVAADLAVGYGGNGALAIAGGAIVNDYSGEIGYTIASESGVHGDATVDGAGSQWNHAFELYVGYGNGTLAITNGASVHNVYGYLGYFPESPGHSSGTATIDGTGSIWISDASLHIGDSGTGIVTISNGGSLVNGEGDLGFNFDSDGTATVTGAQSSWTTNGFIYIGNNGDGTLHVADGGLVSSLGSYGYMSWAAASTSTATIDGPGSTWTNANGFYVGFDGTATLTITNGGSMQNGTFANVGFSPGASGTVNVTGAGSIFGTGGALSIGGNVSGPGGSGALSVDDGGAVSASALNIWNTGTLALDGAANIAAATVTVDAPLGVGAGGATIDGDLVLTSASATTMNVAVGSGGLAVSGTASLNGTLVLELDGAIAAGQYTLIGTAGGLGGSAFASVTVTPPAGMTADVTYDDTHAYLVIASTVPDDLLFRDGFDGAP
jgi:T5SS/PEP-CTERM-associated repeat protein